MANMQPTADKRVSYQGTPIRKLLTVPLSSLPPCKDTSWPPVGTQSCHCLFNGLTDIPVSKSGSFNQDGCPVLKGQW